MRSAWPVLLFVFALVVGVLWWLGGAGAPIGPASTVLPAPADEILQHEDLVAERAAREGRAERLVVEQDAATPSDGDPPETTELPVEGPLLVTVRYADRSPTVAALVAVARGDEVVGRGQTDRAGLFTLQGVGVEPVDLWVSGAVLPPLRQRVPSGVGEVEVVLTDAGVLAGQVLVDGVASGLSVPLVIEGLARPDNLPWPVSRALRRDEVGLAHRVHGQVVWSDAAGRFFVVGLPEGLGFTLAPGKAHRLESGEAGVEVTVPARNLLIRLTTTPLVTGRVVDIEGQPVPDAAVAYGISWRSEAFSGPVVRTGADGRFAVPVEQRDKPLLQVSLEIVGKGGSLARTVQPEQVDPVHGCDLGDLMLVPTRDLSFIVRDREGRPVAGALGVVDDAFDTTSEPTDDEGRAELKGLAAEARSLTVWADRAEAVTVDLPADLGVPLEIVVDPCTWLEVLVTLAETAGPLPDGLFMDVSAEQRLFGSLDSFAPAQSRSKVAGLESRYSTTRTTPDGMSGNMHLRLGADGRVVLQCLEPGVPFELSVKDGLGSTLWGPETVIAGAGPETLHVVLEDLLRQVSVRVTDEQGSPVPGARVALVVDERGPREKTNQAGIAIFESVAADMVDVTVERQGFAPGWRADVPLPVEGPIEVILARGRSVTLRVVDESGRPAAVTTVEALLPSGEFIDGKALGTDRSSWRFVDLAPDMIEFLASVGGREFRSSHDARQPEARLVVPAFGSVRVRWSVPLESEDRYQVAWTVAAEADQLVGRIKQRGGDPGASGIQGWQMLNDAEETAGEMVIPVVFEGSMAFALGCMWPGEELAGPAVVEVEPGAEVAVDLGTSEETGG